MDLSTLSQWLSWIEQHYVDMDLGLARVRQVAKRLNLLQPLCPVMTVAGTNGKGSTVTGLAAIYHAAGYRVGAFTSPYLFHYREQFRINGETVTDADICAAFAAIEAARDAVPLTIFEYGTLAALLLFKNAQVEVMILEVGLGGRLDAVNIIDADVAIITSIGIDHVTWLGDTREKIAIEKAGVCRAHHPVVCGDFEPPITLIETVQQLQAPLYCQGRDFRYQLHEKTWDWSFQQTSYTELPMNALSVQNMSTVLMGVTLLQSTLSVSNTAIKQGLMHLRLIGRIQVVNARITHIYDVAHNPAAILFLRDYLLHTPIAGRTIAVFSMLADKAIAECVTLMVPFISEWHIAPLNTKRAAHIEQLKSVFQRNTAVEWSAYPTIKEAYQSANEGAKPGDRLLIFGSFHTVSEVMLTTQQGNLF